MPYASAHLTTPNSHALFLAAGQFAFVTRNQSLSTFPAITRLGARIKDLEARGWRFEAKAGIRIFRQEVGLALRDMKHDLGRH